jgi:ankyrin repeat protein
LNEVVSVLLKNGAQVNLADAKKDTPLMKSVENGQFEVTRILLINKAKINVPENSGDKYSVLHYAVKHQSIQTIDFLLKNNANFFHCDIKGRTPFDLAV